jgi:GTPase SAR1 family protein
MSLNFSSLNFNKKQSEQNLNSSTILSLAFYDNDEFSFSEKKLFNCSSDESTEQSITNSTKSSLPYVNNSIHKNNLKAKRKDIYGNIIKKGGNHKVSFLDDIKGKPLVEMTIYNSEENCLKSKNYKVKTIRCDNLLFSF